MIKSAMIAIGMLIYSSAAMASGKISIQPTYVFQTKKVVPMIGFHVYEGIFKTVYINNWFGMGEPTLVRDDFTWITNKTSLDIPLNNWKVVVSPGVQFNYILPDHTFDKMAFVKLSVQLW